MLLDVVRAGICGSDLHARHHADAQADVLAEAGYHSLMRSHQSLVLGHEFSGAVAAYGAGVPGLIDSIITRVGLTAGARHPTCTAPRRPGQSTAAALRGSISTFACLPGSPSRSKAAATPGRPTVPVTIGAAVTFPSAIMCSVLRNSSGE